MSTKYKPEFPRIAQLKTADDFLKRLSDLGIEMPFSQEIDPTVFQKKIPLSSQAKTIGNALCILPMEGWDGTTDGRPTENTKRRWKNFAISGAKLLFGCEAVAVCEDGRANPHQLMINEDTFEDFKELHTLLCVEHEVAFATSEDLVIGLQLTHSGRFCKPYSQTKMEPQILYAHPVLNAKFGLKEDYPLLTDAYIDELIQKYIKAAVLAQKAGFDFVDIKHCHGYLGHEFLSAYDREGKYGGSFENRTRFLRDIVAGIRREAPGLDIGIRLSAFDLQPFVTGDEHKGKPSVVGPYKYAFGSSKDGLATDLEEPSAFIHLAQTLGIQLICITAGSPYYNPHVIRPAMFPPSDGYLPPEDPLVGVARQIAFTAQLKKAFPEMIIIGSAYSYLQEWLPHVAHAVLKEMGADLVGFGRMVLSYPDMPADMLKGNVLQRKKICRTFSDCTTAPRNGLVSGCYPLDPYYKDSLEYEELQKIKAQ